MDFNDLLFSDRMSKEQEARLGGYRERWQYYKGEHRQQLKVKKGQPNDNLTINLYRKIVNTGLRFLLGDGLAFELPGGAESAEQKKLDLILALNFFDALSIDLCLNGGVCGHTFLKFVPDGLGTGVPRLINLDPAICSVRWNAEDIARLEAVRIQYESVDAEGKQVYKREEHQLTLEGHWEIVYSESGKNRLGWKEVKREPWPYPWCGVLTWKNLPAPNEFYGEPDIPQDGIVLQDGVNFSASNIQRILRYHAHPKTVATGIKNGNFVVGPDDMAMFPSETAKVFNLEMISDLSSSREFLADLVGWQLQLGNLPDLDPAKVTVGALSGFAIRLMYSDLTFITHLKRMLYGGGFVEMCRRSLEMAGMGPGHIAKVIWPEPLPIPDTEQTTQLQADMDMGLVSRQTAAGERGYDWEQEQQRLQEEQAGQVGLGELLLNNFTKGV